MIWKVNSSDIITGDMDDTVVLWDTAVFKDKKKQRKASSEG